MSKTAVVILNWNGRAFLEQFLPDVIRYNSAGAEIIVADNASTDDSVSWLHAHYPEVRIVQNSVNGGYAKGYNDSLKQIDATYYVLLNSDIEVSANWIEPVIALMDADPAIAACQPKIRAFRHREQFEYAGAAGGFIDKWGYPFCRGRMFDTFETDEGQYDDSCEIFWATGACLFVRAKDYHEVGGLDEDFFAHMEEIDLCWRLKNTGKKIIYCSSSTVYHVGGGTLSKTSPQKTYLNFRNNLVLLAKNHAPGFFWLKLFLRLCLDGVAGIRFTVSGDFKHMFAILRAHFSFYGSLGTTMRKRREMKKRISNYTRSAVYNGNVVYDYYIKGVRKFSELDKNRF